MYIAETQIRVRYAETDQMGVVYYGNYPTYFEVARVESLRSLGMSYKSMENEGVMLPVLEQFMKYIRPARYDDLLTVKTFLKEMPSTRIRYEYEVYNEEKTLLTIGHTVLVFVDSKTMKPRLLPDSLKQLLAPFFENEK
jgi:acyl-CoA thioester hydrolase